MAEALALASGVAGLLALTIQVYATSSKYVTDVRSAKGTVQQLLRELRELKIVLTKLDSIFEYSADDETAKKRPMATTAFQDADDYVSILETLRKTLESEAGGNSFSSKVKALKWPFSVEKTKATINDLRRHVENFRAIMDVDAFAMIADTLVGVGRLERCQDDERTKTILKWFSPLEMNKSQVDNFGKRHGQSGTWLLQHPSFLTWISQASRDMLWCPGNPGAGKSILSSIVIDFLLRSQATARTAIAYLYCDPKDPENQTAATLTATILKQLLTQLPNLPVYVLDFYEKLSSKNDVANIDQLRSLLSNACASYNEIYLVVDALDEFQARPNFLPVLSQLNQTGVRVLVTSRPHKPDIADFFKNSPRIDIIATDDDIEGYVAEQINCKFAYKEIAERLSAEMKASIISTITKNARGLFLKAYWLSKNVCEAQTVKKIKEALNSVPPKMHEIYQTAVEKIKGLPIETRDYALAILAWIFYAKRPLRVEELRHALAIQFTSHDQGRPTEVDHEDLLAPSFMVNVCESLVTIEKESQVIRLSHTTVHEYLETVRNTLFVSAEQSIASTCIEYLLLDAFADGPSPDAGSLNQRLQEFPLLQYAACHWGDHVRGHGERSTGDLIMEFISNDEKACNAVQALDSVEPEFFRWCNQFGRRPNNFHPLQNAASQGLDIIVQRLLNQGADIGLTDGTFKSAAHWAAWAGYRSTLKLLLDRGFGLYSICDKFTLIEVACDQGREEVVQLLLDRGFDVNTQGFCDHTALCTSAQMGRLNILKLLLDLGADPHIPTMFNETPLALAAWNGHTEVVRLLLDLGLDVHSQSLSGATPLHGAARLGQLDTVKVLVEHGADVNRGAISGETPLHVAAIGGFDRVIEYLLANGANIDKKCSDEDRHNCEVINSEIGSCPERMFCIGRCLPGSTALIMAACCDRVETLKLLLAHGADKHAKTTKGLTALTLAISRSQIPIMDVLYNAGAEIQGRHQLGSDLTVAANEGNAAVLEWLLDHGVDVEIRDWLGNNALCVAATRGSLEVVKYLVGRGVAINARGNGEKTPLLSAALREHTHVVRWLIERGADMEIDIVEGMTMLFFVAAAGKADMVKLLVELGANFEARNHNGGTPLHMACLYGYPDVAKVLIESGASIQGSDEEHGSPLFLATEAENEKLVQMLMDAGASAAHLTPWGTPLHAAASAGSLSLVEIMVQSGASLDAKTPDQDRNTALHIAVSQGSADIVKVLVNAQADVHVMNGKGLLPRDIAINNRDNAILDILTGRTGSGRVYDKNPQVVLIEENDGVEDNSPIKRTSRYSQSDERAANLLDFPAVQLVPGSSAFRGLSRSPQPPTIRDAHDESDEEDDLDISRQWSMEASDGWSSSFIYDGESSQLLDAVRECDLEHVRRILLKNRGILNRVRSRNGRSALHIACASGDVRMVRLLIENGADLYAEDPAGCLPIHCIANCSTKTDNHEVMKLILEEGVDPNVKSDRNHSPLTLASEFGFTKCVKELLSMKYIDVNSYDDDGDSSILMAANNGHKEIVAMLLEFDEIDVEWKNKRGDSALGMAYRKNHKEIHKMLKDFLAAHPRPRDAAVMPRQSSFSYSQRQPTQIAVGDDSDDDVEVACIIIGGTRYFVGRWAEEEQKAEMPQLEYSQDYNPHQPSSRPPREVPPSLTPNTLLHSQRQTSRTQPPLPPSASTKPSAGLLRLGLNDATKPQSPLGAPEEPAKRSGFLAKLRRGKKK